MSSKGRQRSTSIDPSSPHSRVTSLSIARSPSILSIANPLDPSSNTTTDPFSTIDHHTPTPTHTLTRTLSHPVSSSQRTIKPKPALSDIPSDEDSPEVKSIALDDGQGSFERRPSAGRRSGEYGDHTSSVGMEGDDEESGSCVGYAGDFQKPDSKEMMVIMLSLGGVALLSLAAGFTTIYDWVL